MTDLEPLNISGPLTPSAFKFIAQGRTILNITCDGRIEIGDGFEPDEAGRKAIDGMRHQLSFIIQAAVEAEREACAKVAYESSVEGCESYHHIASLIRARSTIT